MVFLYLYVRKIAIKGDRYVKGILRSLYICGNIAVRLPITQFPGYNIENRL